GAVFTAGAAAATGGAVFAAATGAAAWTRCAASSAFTFSNSAANCSMRAASVFSSAIAAAGAPANAAARAVQIRFLLIVLLTFVVIKDGSRRLGCRGIGQGRLYFGK